jgi:hypothetical protein
MKHLYFLLLFLFSSLHAEREPLYISHVHRLQQCYALEVHELGLQLMSVGGCLMQDVEKIGLGFYIEKRVNVEEARQLYVSFAESFRKMVNADRKIRPYLRNYPATINELKFSLSFSRNPHCRPTDVVHVFYASGEVCYFAINTQEIHHETYDEALRIVQEEKKNQTTPSSSLSEYVGTRKNHASFDAKILKECPPMHHSGSIKHHGSEDIGFQEMLNENKVHCREVSNQQKD